MPYMLNGDPVTTDFEIDDVRHPFSITYTWSREDLENLGLEWVEPVRSVDDILRTIDAERDRRMALDFAYDFGATDAINDAGETVEAGIRSLQMSPTDRANWQTLHGLAVASILAGSPLAVMPMRCEDNVNVQITAQQVLAVLTAATLRGSAILFHGASLKAAVRAGENVNIQHGWPE